MKQKITIKVDTKDDEEIVKAHFDNIFKEIFPILINMKEVKYNMKGIINYDTDLSLIEFSGFIIRERFFL